VAALLVDDPTHARPIVSELLKGRVTIAPSGTAKKRWTVTGEGTLAGLFSKANRIPRVGVPKGIRERVETRFSGIAA